MDCSHGSGCAPRINPRTLASGVKAISNVMNPPRITDPKKADLAIEIWEDRIGFLDSEYGETLSSKMKMAVLYAMLPKDLQENVLDKCAVSWDKAKEQETALIFSRAKEEVKNVAKSRRNMIIPKPMDVDAIKRDHWTDEYTYDHDENHDTKENDNVCFVGRDDKGKEKRERSLFLVRNVRPSGGRVPQQRCRQRKQRQREMVAATRDDHQGLFWLWEHKPLLQRFSVRPKNSQHVREVVADEEPEVLFIGHTEAITCEGDGHEHEWLKVGTRRQRKVPCKPPPGLWSEEFGRDTSTEH